MLVDEKKVPAVGYYWPRHKIVERSKTGGVISPVRKRIHKRAKTSLEVSSPGVKSLSPNSR